MTVVTARKNLGPKENYIRIAADSQMVTDYSGSTVADQFIKEDRIQEFKGLYFGAAGYFGQFKTFMWWLKDSYEQADQRAFEALFASDKEVSALLESFFISLEVDHPSANLEYCLEMLIVCNFKVFTCFNWMDVYEAKSYAAIGSGSPQALAAMMAGASAAKACEIACELDQYCQLPVNYETIISDK